LCSAGVNYSNTVFALQESQLSEIVHRMQFARRRVSYALVFCLAPLACAREGHESEARARLATILRDSLGATTDPNVAFITDGGHRNSHLYVMFDTTAVPNVSDSVFELRARDLARFAMRHYEKAGELDSVTVATRESVQPGLWRIHHSSAFGVPRLKERRVP
jgi:hypothetical protein